MRSNINEFLRKNGVKGQERVRKASWKHSELYNMSPAYREEADEFYKDIGRIPCCMSKQDSYRISHFVAAVCLCLLRPEEAIKLQKQKALPVTHLIAYETEEKLECKQYKDALYSHLWEVIKNYGNPTQNQIDVKGLERRVSFIEDFLGIGVTDEKSEE